MSVLFPETISIGLGEAGITAIFGYAVVFSGLLILMALLYAIGAVFKAKDKKTAEKNKTTSDESIVQEVIPVKEAPLAPGSAGHVKLFDVPDKEAAMVMAVVAHKMQKPLNELHFISIKEIKSDEV